MTGNDITAAAYSGQRDLCLGLLPSASAAFVYLGELIEFGTTSKVFTTPHDQTQDYITGLFE